MEEIQAMINTQRASQATPFPRLDDLNAKPMAKTPKPNARPRS
jgi:hypothetical protein